MSQEIEFFDLPSRSPCKAWSINTFRTRFILNHKRIPYRTTWIEYPDIEPTFKSFGISPNESGTPYTVPAIKLPDGRYVMDSLPIAQELEKLHPEPSLYLDSETFKQVTDVLPSIVGPLVGVLFPKVNRKLLNPKSAEYFTRTREARFGMSFEQLEREKGGDEAFEEAKEGLGKLGAILKAKGGPFFEGETVGYADIIVVGALTMYERIGEGVFERLVGMEPALGRLWEASAGFRERMDH